MGYLVKFIELSKLSLFFCFFIVNDYEIYVLEKFIYMIRII